MILFTVLFSSISACQYELDNERRVRVEQLATASRVEEIRLDT